MPHNDYPKPNHRVDRTAATPRRFVTDGNLRRHRIGGPELSAAVGHSIR